MASSTLTHTLPRGSSFWRLLLICLLAPVLLLVVALARFELTFAGRIFPGVQAMSVDLTGMNREEAYAALQAAAITYDLPPLALRHGDQVWPLKAGELGVAVDVRPLAQQAFAIGRTGDLAANLAEQWQVFWQGRRLSPPVTVRPGAVSMAVATRTASLNRAVTEPKLTLSDLQVVVSAPRPGQMVDVAATRDAIIQRLYSGEGGVVDVVIRPLQAAGADMSAEQETIQNLLDRPIILADNRGEFQFALDPATLVGMLSWTAGDGAAGSVRPQVDEASLRGLVEGWAQQVARPPLNARFDFEPKSGMLIELSPSIEGYALDVEATVAALLQAIAGGERQIALPLQVIRPAVASDDAAGLGIKELVASGASSFKGSSAARVANIEVAAAKFVGVVIPAGGVFSFNEHVGDVTAANGFEDSLVIAGDTTAVGIGGGVCQVSTTVFRAAWLGGFPLVERWNHGYIVSWYGAPGLDATIYTPRVDFKFRNTTGHALLIKPIVDKAKGTLTFEFYGTRPNWQVETGKPVYQDEKPPPPPLYIEDRSLPAGKVVQFDWAVEGKTAEVKRTVRAADGAVLINETLRSTYRPWQAKYRFGPGFTPPANAEVRWAQ
ncbi:MAG: VanW family protein [Caldilineales bacterium]|nr:VanW family protein [Caldilineales bacterium]